MPSVPVLRHSRGEAPVGEHAGAPVWLADTLGEMLSWMALADLAFGLGWGDLRTGLLWAVAVFTVVSWVAYFFEGLRALRAVEVV